MPRRALIWALALPLVAASVLGGHALAYAATGIDPGPMHEYLEHAPQVVVVLALLALLAAATEQGLAARFDALPYLAPGVFATQEHLERIAHTGHVPFLLTDRTFLVGLALQVPLALLIARLSRMAVEALGALRSRPTRPPRLWSLPAERHPVRCALPVVSFEARHTPVRGPPGVR